jgi:hypothetical protein
MAPLFEHYGVGLWMPEVGGRVDWHAKDHEQTMLALGLSSKRAITRTRIRVRTAMAAQTREEGRYLGGRPPCGYRLADAGPHSNKAHAAWGRRAHRLEPDPATAPVVRWMFAQRLEASPWVWRLRRWQLSIEGSGLALTRFSRTVLAVASSWRPSWWCWFTTSWDVSPS